MKILQVVPYFFPAWGYGGPAKLVYDTSLEFSKQRNKVVVYTSDAYDASDRMPIKKRISPTSHLHVHYFTNLSNTFAYRLNIYLPLGLFWHSLREIRSFDVIHLHDFYTLANVWITFLARLFHIPYILSVHGCLEDERMKQKSIFKRVFMILFGKQMLYHASALIATSENEDLSFRSFGIKTQKIKRIGHGVNPSEFETNQTSIQARIHFGIPKKALVFTYVGRIHSIKGLDLLVEAFTRLHNPKTYLAIAGSDDGYLPMLTKMVSESIAKKRIKLLGPIFGAEKAKLFKASDVFVYPYRSEGF
jgi:glycosyltransferase involved in cell wall biosynthesis